MGFPVGRSPLEEVFMFDYKDAIENAIAIAQSCRESPCAHPGNTLLYFFLQEALEERSGCEHRTSLNVSRGISNALQTLKQHPLRVYDIESAMLVRGIGPKIARMIFDTLFATNPPEEPSDEERNATFELQLQQRNSSKGSLRTKREAQSTDTMSSHGRSPNAGAKQAPKRKPSTSKTAKEYIPTIGSSNYAILITLFIAQRGPDKLEHISKAELIDRAEASGLSNVAIRNEGGHQPFSKRAKFGRGGGSSGPPSFSYGGWSSFGTLKDKGLVAVWSNPIKISLTVAGLALAQRLFEDALARGKVDPLDGRASTDAGVDAGADAGAGAEESLPQQGRHQEIKTDAEEVEVISLVSPETSPLPRRGTAPPLTSNGMMDSMEAWKDKGGLRSHFQSQEQHFNPSTNMEETGCSYSLPPLPPGSILSDVYDIILLIDGREQYNRASGASLEVHLNRLRATGLNVEERQLPIGDALWIARAKSPGRDGRSKSEYVLDYILERKSVDDLLQSIKGSRRYSSQKFFLKRCGVRVVYYLIEGDPDTLSSSTEYKTVLTASTSTEVNDGFRVLRTTNVTETFGMYRLLTRSIAATCCSPALKICNSTKCCSTWEEFAARVNNAKKATTGTTVKEVWHRMLCHVPGLGPDAAARAVSFHPCPRRLYEAYKACNCGIQNLSKIFNGNTSSSRSGLSHNKALSGDKTTKVLEALFPTNRHR